MCTPKIYINPWLLTLLESLSPSHRQISLIHSLSDSVNFSSKTPSHLPVSPPRVPGLSSSFSTQTHQAVDTELSLPALILGAQTFLHHHHRLSQSSLIILDLLFTLPGHRQLRTGANFSAWHSRPFNWDLVHFYAHSPPATSGGTLCQVVQNSSAQHSHARSSASCRPSQSTSPGVS